MFLEDTGTNKKLILLKKNKVARFFQLVVAVKEVEATNEHGEYRRVHVSFQSTSSCNISTVNALSKCELSVSKREREREREREVLEQINKLWVLK